MEMYNLEQILRVAVSDSPDYSKNTIGFYIKTIKENNLTWEEIIKFFQKELIYKKSTGTSLVVQWLKPLAPNARSLNSIPGQGTRSHMLQL